MARATVGFSEVDVPAGSLPPSPSQDAGELAVRVVWGSAPSLYWEQRVCVQGPCQALGKCHGHTGQHQSSTPCAGSCRL